MSRRRWFVLLGPPLVVAAAVPGLSGGLALPAGGTSPLPDRPIAACGPAAPLERPSAAARPGAWWRTEAALDASGALGGWTLRTGAPGVRTAVLDLPAASTVTGPVGGLVVVASEGPAGGPASVVHVVDALRGCTTDIGVTDRIARRAVVDPGGDGVLAYLLEPGSRTDLGVWRIAADGRDRRAVLEPLPDSLRDAAGMDRVWATDLRVDAATGRLAVQSCNPDACVTRVVDLSDGMVVTLAGRGQGPIVGLSGATLVTWAACRGLPCPVVTWELSGGTPRTLAAEASGAALTGDGRRAVVMRSGPAGTRELMAVDVASGTTRSIGVTRDDALPLSGGAGMVAGLEVGRSVVGIGTAGGIPVPLDLDDPAAFAGSPGREVQP